MYSYPTRFILRSVAALLFVFSISFTSVGQSCSYTTWDFPFPTDADYGWSCGLYLPTQVGGAQTMSQISMSLYGPSFMNYSYTNQDIYIRHTNDTEYTSSNDDYPGTAGFTHVYSGTLDFTSGDGIYTFSFNVNNFNYNGTQTLEVLFINQSGSQYIDGFEFHRTDLAQSSDPDIGKYGSGGSWGSATSFSSAVQFNLALQFNNIGDACQYPLPVTLLSSKLECQDDFSTLKWSTASEQNNDYFTIEASEEGEKWRELQKVDGAGSTNEVKNYYQNLSNNFKYYRLSQTDYNGSTTMLNTFSVNCGNDIDVETYPNPAKNELFVHFPKSLVVESISLLDLTGSEIKVCVKNRMKNKIKIDVSSLKSGVYILRIDSFQKVIMRKIVID